MLRVEITETGHDPLPPVDVGDDVFIIGSSPSARIRLPAGAPEGIRIAHGRYTTAHGESGPIGDGVTLTLGGYRLRIAPAPRGSIASPPQRTESLARELMRNLLGADSAPSLTVESGPLAGATRKLGPPDFTLVIGRGDEAAWMLADPDLSRAHAELRRGWDGTRLVDLGSKNGTRVDGTPVPPAGMLLRTGARIELGPVVLRFRDPADVEIAPPAPTPLASTLPPAATHVSTVPFYAAVAIMLIALVGFVCTLLV